MGPELDHKSSIRVTIAWDRMTRFRTDGHTHTQSVVFCISGSIPSSGYCRIKCVPCHYTSITLYRSFCDPSGLKWQCLGSHSVSEIADFDLVRTLMAEPILLLNGRRNPAENKMISTWNHLELDKIKRTGFFFPTRTAGGRPFWMLQRCATSSSCLSIISRRIGKMADTSGVQATETKITRETNNK